MNTIKWLNYATGYATADDFLKVKGYLGKTALEQARYNDKTAVVNYLQNIGTVLKVTTTNFTTTTTCIIHK